MSRLTLANVLANNYADATSNGNYIYGNFDSNSDGGWKGFLFLGENTDGSLTFAFWDDNFVGSQIYSERYSFVWTASGTGTLDTSVTASTSAISVFCPCGTTGPAVHGYGLVNQSDQSQYFTASYQHVPVLTSTSWDTFSFTAGTGTFNAFRYRLHPTGGAGTKLTIEHINHYENGQGGNNHFDDGTGSGISVLTLKGATPVIPKPVLVSVTPNSSERLQQVTLACTNMTGLYTYYFGSQSHPAVVNSQSATQVQLIVPVSLPLGPTNLYALSATYTTNSLPFTVTGQVLTSRYSNQISLLFPAPVTAPPPPTLVAISITPQNETLTEGDTVQFHCTASYSDSSTKDITSTGAVWSVNNTANGVGSIGSASGFFAAITAGTGVVVKATYGGLTAQTTSIIIAAKYIPPPPLVSLTVVPSTANVLVGTTEQFAYIGTNSVGGTIYPQVAWTIQNGNSYGSINQNGLFTAIDLPHILETKFWQGTAGNYLPPLYSGEIATTPTSITTITPPINYVPSGIGTYVYARITGFLIPTVAGMHGIGIKSGDGANLYINGVGIAFNLSMVQNYSTAPYIYGQIQLQAGIRYPLVIEYGVSSTTDTGLTLQWLPPGTSTYANIPLPAIEGDSATGTPCIVTATAQDGSNISGSATVTITAPDPPPPPSPSLASISISPKTAIVASGSTQTFIVTASDQYGNKYSYTNVTYSVVNGGGSGTIDPNSGLFMAEIAGTNVTVYATSNDNTLLSDSASVVITPGVLTKIVVSPSSTILQVSQSQQFTVVGYDNYNNQINLTSALVTWTVVGGIGTITSTGAFTATTFGSGKVVASYMGFSGQAGVNVLTIVGGVAIATTPQQPFGRVYIRDSVDAALVVDTRKRGGGVLDASLASQDDFWWDLSPFDGTPFQLFGAYVVGANLPDSNSTVQGSYDLLAASIATYGIPQYLGLIMPGSLVPSS